MIGFVLTGARDDGTIGMRAIRQRGGLTIVQDPVEAIFPGMPASVMQHIVVDYTCLKDERGGGKSQISDT